MRKAICNTSPLLFLHRIDVLDWMPQLFSEVWTPSAVMQELEAGVQKGHDLPKIKTFDWVRIVDPKSVPSEWLALDFGLGELNVLALGLENKDHIVMIDDALARRIGRAAGLEVWGTLRILLEAKSKGLTKTIEPLISQLEHTGMWISSEIRQRILKLADEDK